VQKLLLDSRKELVQVHRVLTLIVFESVISLLHFVSIEIAERRLVVTVVLSALKPEDPCGFTICDLYYLPVGLVAKQRDCQLLALTKLLVLVEENESAVVVSLVLSFKSFA
jgi:hypothetical protein